MYIYMSSFLKAVAVMVLRHFESDAAKEPVNSFKPKQKKRLHFLTLENMSYR